MRAEALHLAATPVKQESPDRRRAYIQRHNRSLRPARPWHARILIRLHLRLARRGPRLTHPTLFSWPIARRGVRLFFALIARPGSGLALLLARPKAFTKMPSAGRRL